MEAIEINLYNSLKKYYNHLFNTGYSGSGDLEKLLVYIFITEIFEYSLVPYINDEDYNIIGKALSCLYGSTCSISYPNTTCSSYFLEDILNPLKNELRLVENSIGNLYSRDDEARNPRSVENNTF